jgi:hypothetical protein
VRRQILLRVKYAGSGENSCIGVGEDRLIPLPDFYPANLRPAGPSQSQAKSASDCHTGIAPQKRQSCHGSHSDADHASECAILQVTQSNQENLL